MRKIIVNGSGGVGKDSFIKFCTEYLSTVGKKCACIATIDPYKNIAAMLGWQGEKTEKARKFLSDLKVASSEYNDFPIINMNARCAQLEKDGYDVVFIMMREPEEIKRFKDFSVLITNRNVKGITSNMADAGVYDCSYDYIIHNDGSLEDLSYDAIKFCKQVCDRWQNEKTN